MDGEETELFLGLSVHAMTTSALLGKSPFLINDASSRHQ